MRCFVAVELTPSIVRSLEREADRLRGLLPDRSVRWLRPSSMHLTLKFLGETTPEQKDALWPRIVSGLAPLGAFEVSIGGLGIFPDVRRPRVLWIGVSEPTGALAALQQAVEQAAAQLGFPREGRPYSPHLTLARVGPGLPAALRGKLVEVLRSTQIGSLGSMPVREIALFRSELHPQGAVYTRLGVTPLGVAV